MGIYKNKRERRKPQQGCVTFDCVALSAVLNYVIYNLLAFNTSMVQN